MNKKRKGELSEAKILARLIENGEQVAVPFGDSQRYDLVLVRNCKAVRVQCKTGWHEGNCLCARAVSHNPFNNIMKKYTGDADLFMIYDQDTGIIYSVPVSKVRANLIRLRLKPSKFSNALLAKDFEY